MTPTYERIDTTVAVKGDGSVVAVEDCALSNFSPGVYSIHAFITFPNNSNGYRFAQFTQNTIGLAQERISAINGSSTCINLSAVSVLSSNNYINLNLQQNSGTEFNVNVRMFVTKIIGLS